MLLIPKLALDFLLDVKFFSYLKSFKINLFINFVVDVQAF